MSVIQKILSLNIALILCASLYSFIYQSPFIFKLFFLMICGLLAEILIVYIQKQKLRYYGLGSAFLAGVLTCSLPPTMPSYMLIFGIIFAVCIIKPFLPRFRIFLNGVIVGRLFLMMLFPEETTKWGNAIDGIASATPLEFYKFYDKPWEIITWSKILFGPIDGSWIIEDGFKFCNFVPGSPGSNIPFLLIIIGIIFSLKGISNWRTSIAYALSFSAINMIFGYNPIYNILTASSLFCMVFLFSDPYSTPRTNAGKWIFGIIIGIINGCIREWGFLEIPYTEAIVFAILFANLIMPLVNKLIIPSRAQ